MRFHRVSQRFDGCLWRCRGFAPGLDMNGGPIDQRMGRRVSAGLQAYKRCGGLIFGSRLTKSELCKRKENDPGACSSLVAVLERGAHIFLAIVDPDGMEQVYPLSKNRGLYANLVTCSHIHPRSYSRLYIRKLLQAQHIYIYAATMVVPDPEPGCSASF